MTGVDTPEEVARLVKEKVQEGYLIQVKVGGRPVEVDIETTHRVWEVTKGKGFPKQLMAIVVCQAEMRFD